MIELNARDLEIKTLDDDREIVRLKNGTAFDEGFMALCKEAGVKPAYVDKDDKDENKD